MVYNALPAGYEESSNSEDDFEDGFYHSKPKVKPKIIEKSPKDLMKERLLQHLSGNNLNAIKEELDHGPVKGFDIDEPVDSRWTLLFQACFLARPDIVQYLIEERGADTSPNEAGESPLMVVCYSNGDSDDVLKIAQLLIKNSTNISLSNTAGVTALMFASSHGHIEVVKYLLTLNDAFDAIDNECKNALFHAIEGKQKEIAKILIDAGTDLNVTNNFGFTAKHFAYEDNQLEIVELFPEEVYEYQTPSAFMSYNRFEDLIPGMSEV